MNTASWIILGIIIVVVILVVLFMVKTKDKGCCGCSKDKDDCPYCNKNK